MTSNGACRVNLLPGEHLLVCVSAERFAGGYRVEVAGAAVGCACPKCGVVSRRVHACYQRRVRDLPVQGERVIIRLQARKFLCDNRGCSRRVFCERFGDVIRPFARMTGRLEAALQTMVLLTSAKVAERIGHALGYPGSASTLLRCAHRYEPPGVRACEVGVDDFAFRRGRTYGTIIIDLATHQPIELLPERSVQSLTAYLEAHPEVRVVARDRDARYAEAISLGAPDATVVVDRWHLLRNLTEAFERLVTNRWGAWRATLQAHVDAQHDNVTVDAAGDGFASEREQPGGDAAGSDALPLARPSRISSKSPREHQTTAERLARRQHLLDQVHELSRKGWTKIKIAQHLKLDRRTVATYLQRDTPPDHSRRHPTPAQIDQHHEYLRERWHQGCRNASQLTRELHDRGYTGPKRAVMRYVHHWRSSDDGDRPGPTPPDAAIVVLASPKKLAWNLLQDEPDTTTRALLEHVPDAEHHTNLARAGLDAIKQHNPHAWHAWRNAILEQPNTPLRSFVTGLQRDHDAIDNALTLKYSNGPTEGNVNRLKLIKRTMYGRASFALLRKKVLYQPARAPPDPQPHPT